MALPCELYFLRSYTFILSCARGGGREGEKLEVRGKIGAIGGVGAIRAIGLSGRTRRVTVVGTHDLCVRCVKGYGVRALMGTDALPLDTDRASVHGITRLALIQRTHRSCVPTTVTRLMHLRGNRKCLGGKWKSSTEERENSSEV